MRVHALAAREPSIKRCHAARQVAQPRAQRLRRAPTLQQGCAEGGLSSGRAHDAYASLASLDHGPLPHTFYTAIGKLSVYGKAHTRPWCGCRRARVAWRAKAHARC